LSFVFHPLLEAVFCAFEQAGVRWCLLRVPSDPAAPRGDVDLLVDPADGARARVALEGLAFLHVPALSYRAHSFFLGYHQPTHRWIQLDVGTHLSFGPYYTLRSGAEAGCLARRRREGVAVVLADDDHFWTLLLHCLVDKVSIAPHHRRRLSALAESVRGDGDLALLVDRLCAAPWSAARVVDCARRGDWATLEALAPSLLAAWGRRQRTAAGVLLAYRVLRVLDKAYIPLRRRGFSVALLGPDGAGKSTLAAALQHSFHAPVHAVYMGLGDDRLIRLARLRVPGFGAPGRLLTLWLRYLEGRYHQTRGRLVVFDRYCYDARVPPAQRLRWSGRLSRWLLAHACLAPDLVLVLDAPGEVAFRRKGEHSVGRLECERRVYLALQRKIPRLQVVDAARAAAAVRSDVLDRISLSYLGRAGRRARKRHRAHASR
jgi:thymidylate kinase